MGNENYFKCDFLYLPGWTEVLRLNVARQCLDEVQKHPLRHFRMNLNSNKNLYYSTKKETLIFFPF